MKLKKKTIMAASLITGVVMLTTSAFANYVNSSGYEDCKRAIKRLLKEDNYTMTIEADFLIDEQSMGTFKFTQLLDADGDVKLNWFIDEYDTERSFTSREYFQDGELVRISKYRDETESYYIDDENPDLHHFFKINEEDEKTVNKAIRFVELFADMIVGDLKNNMLLIDSDDVCDTYAINLESYQMPELISAGLSLMGSANANPEYYGYRAEELADMTTFEIAERDPMFLLGEEPVIDSVNLQVKIDHSGRILDVTGDFTILGTDYNGTPHTLKFIASGSVSDYDTTVPERVDLTGKPVRRASQWREERIAFIDKELADEDLTEEDIENLNEEKEALLEEIERIAQGKDAEEAVEVEINTDENSSPVVVTSFPESTSSSSVVIIN